MNEQQQFKPYPWQQAQWQQMRQAQAMAKLPHAILLHGIEGLGKLHFAQSLATGLHCEKPQAELTACGQCHACHLIAINSHPDLRIIAPEEGSKIIKIDQIRAVKDFLSVSSHSSAYRILIISPAEAMNRAAANALLKALEEPGAGAILLLVCHHPALLPVTVKSRCRALPFYPLDAAAIKTWLQTTAAGDLDLLAALSQGAPLNALSWDDNKLAQRQQVLDQLVALHQGCIDPIRLANDYLQFELNDIMNWLTGWLLDTIKIFYGLKQPALINVDRIDAMTAYSQRINIRALFLLLEKLIDIKHHFLQGMNPNKQLLLEDLLIYWSESVQVAG